MRDGLLMFGFHLVPHHHDNWVCAETGGRDSSYCWNPLPLEALNSHECKPSLSTAAGEASNCLVLFGIKTNRNILCFLVGASLVHCLQVFISHWKCQD